MRERISAGVGPGDTDGSSRSSRHVLVGMWYAYRPENCASGKKAALAPLDADEDATDTPAVEKSSVTFQIGISSFFPFPKMVLHKRAKLKFHLKKKFTNDFGIFFKTQVENEEETK